ncbi:DUF3800 domain-containing protein [Microbacterium sp. NPDC057407]|uniref:DUF3800 domain-containing protein n=1 Tax=Microbacterium sp. NPDC057407 TaxID=3346120 RepID=UPI00366B3F33
MLLFYVDECGDSSLRLDPKASVPTLAPGVSRYFTLSAVGIRDSARKPMADALFETKKRHFGAEAMEGPWADTEIKGRHLRRAERGATVGVPLQSPAGYSRLATPKRVTGLVNDLGLILYKHRPLVLSVTIDKAQLIAADEKYRHPLGVAYALLHERVAFTLEKLYVGESAVLIADQQTEHERYFRSGDMHRMRHLMASKLAVKPNFELVVDKPLWLDTDLSSWDRELLQLADIVAYSCSECVTSGVAPATPTYLWPQIRRSMAVHWRAGEIHQAGFTVYPRKRTYYPQTE